MPRRTLLDSPEWLRREYSDLGRTQEDIANELGCALRTVQLALERHGIPRRAQGRHEARYCQRHHDL